jgi:DNA-binding response OmpR family regulator
MFATENVEKQIDTSQKRILIIEDEVMMGFLLDDMLTLLGYDIAGLAQSINDANEQIEHESFDAAILDVNLNGQKTFGLAAQLQEKNVPFLFSTGYDKGSLPEAFRGLPTLQKPYNQTQLGNLLNELLNDFAPAA